MDSVNSSGRYVLVAGINELQNEFNMELSARKLDKERDGTREIREFMFEFFETESFKKIYFQIAKNIADALNLDLSSIALQMLPTARVFRPGKIGTSFHCDYWYGHGAKSHTVWIPLSELNADNTFRVCIQKSEDNLYREIEEKGLYVNIPNEMIVDSSPVLPNPGEAFIFSSKLLHGSPLNTSTCTRLSMDFRLSSSNDATSTKDLANYYHFESGDFILPRHELEGKRLLKYICGGKGKNTFLQHILIEETAKRFKMNVAEQEAEIERFGHPIFKSYLNDKMSSQNIDGLIIASKSILDQESFEFAKRSGKIVWCALENDFITRLD
jgi:ectoine hydroxylase-related dioxygenase (phytanoyl-CoA dioxygenase family)